VEFIQSNWHWAALAVVSGSLLILDMIRTRGSNAAVSPMQATLLINREDAEIIDVRSPAEFGAGHIANARHIPLNELDQRRGELDKFKDRPLIVCCQTGARSSSAVASLRKAGFEKAVNLQGGLMEWEKAGQPVTRKRKSK